VLEQSLERYDAWEPAINAWAAVDRHGARRLADELSLEARAGTFRGPLHGVPIGVKDVVDVAGFATRAGSATRTEGSAASTDAEVVRRLRAAGAIILGKTVTTEFAFTDPSGTRNPYNTEHTPGGSSSGSGAAVSAGVVPLAIGTQTAGSLCRPAAFCGVSAFKPTRGLVALDGVVPCGASFDTVGVISGRAEDARIYFEALTGLPIPSRERRPYRFGILPERYYEGVAAADAIDALKTAVALLTERGHAVGVLDPQLDFAAVIRDHRCVMVSDAYEAHADLLHRSAAVLGPNFRKALREGREVSGDERDASLRRLALGGDALWQSAAAFDGLLLLPTTGEAPAGFATTGNQDLLTPWTAFGGPLFVVPVQLSKNGLPLAVMVATAPGFDQTALQLGARVGDVVPALPSPELKKAANRSLTPI
jgi:aspartyl-tRNA(Asn)/glutamyl-tRNA(Gln) amidotransferase subunit A